MPRPAPAESPSSLATTRPRRRLAVVTCMDARIDPLAALGLDVGDAHVIRNAGARVTDDVVRSLAVSCRLAEARHVWVLHHTGCAMLAPTDEALRDRFAEPPPDDVALHSIDDHVRVLTADVAALRGHPALPDAVEISGGILDLDTGECRPVVGGLTLPAPDEP